MTRDLFKAKVVVPAMSAAILYPVTPLVLSMSRTKKNTIYDVKFNITTGKRPPPKNSGTNKWDSHGTEVILKLTFDRGGPRVRKIKECDINPKNVGGDPADKQRQTDLLIKIQSERRPPQSLLKNPLPTQLKIPITCDPGDRVFVSVSGEKMKQKDFEFLCRHLPPENKLLEFLEFQYPLIYGPSGVSFNKGVYQSWQRWRKPGKSYWITANGKKVYMISATGGAGGENGYTCSPLVAMFLHYWLNFHKKRRKSPIGYPFVKTAGAHLEGIYDTFKKYLTLVPVSEEFFTKYKQEWNEFKKIKKKKRRRRSADQQQRFEKLKSKKPPVKKRFFKAYKRGDTDWLTFMNQIDTKPHPAGTIYVCGSSGHAWLVMYLDGNFAVDKKFIFGHGPNGVDEGWYDNPIASGWYKIHASGPGPIIFKKQKTFDEFKEILKNTAKKSTFAQCKTFFDNVIAGRANPRPKLSRKPPDGYTYTAVGGRYSETEKRDEILINLYKGLNEAVSSGADVVGCFRNTPLVWMNGRLKVEPTGVSIAYALDKDGNEIWKSVPIKIFRAYKLENARDPDKDILDPNTGWVLENMANGTEQHQFDCRPLEWEG